MAVASLKRLFTTGEYHAMLEAGIFSEADRVELIEGEILQMTPIGRRHASCVKRLNALFSRALGSRALLGVQDPVHLDDFSEPQPDLSLLRPREDFYLEAHPHPADILLVIEVADTSLGADRTTKVPLYGRSGVPETWLLDLPQAVLEVHREPTSNGYRTLHRLRAGDSVSPLSFPELELDVAELLGPER